MWRKSKRTANGLVESDVGFDFFPAGVKKSDKKGKKAKSKKQNSDDEDEPDDEEEDDPDVEQSKEVDYMTDTSDEDEVKKTGGYAEDEEPQLAKKKEQVRKGREVEERG